MQFFTYRGDLKIDISKPLGCKSVNETYFVCKTFTVTVLSGLVSYAKLSPLRPKWLFKPALISGSLSVRQMKVFDFSWTGH